MFALTTAFTCATLLTSTSGTSSSTRATAPAQTQPASEAPHLDVGDARNQALLVLGAGVAASIASATAFVTGFDAERELRATVHDEADADSLLNKRTISGW